jgi:hypothetical protein
VVCDVLVDITILVAFRLGMTDQNDHLFPALARSSHVVEQAAEHTLGLPILKWKSVGA